jgi:oligopeptide transport system substrate-binding protein
MKINQFIIIFISLFLIMSCISMEKDKQEGPAPTEVPENKDQQEEKKPNELIVALGPTTFGFDPLHAFTSIEAQFYTAIYEGLVSYDPYDLYPVPALARR